MEEGIDEGEITESEPDIDTVRKHRQLDPEIEWPGKWRLAVPNNEQEKHIFMRFATKGLFLLAVLKFTVAYE